MQSGIKTSEYQFNWLLKIYCCFQRFLDNYVDMLCYTEGYITLFVITQLIKVHDS